MHYTHCGVCHAASGQAIARRACLRSGDEGVSAPLVLSCCRQLKTCAAPPLACDAGAGCRRGPCTTVNMHIFNAAIVRTGGAVRVGGACDAGSGTGPGTPIAASNWLHC